MTHLDFLLDYTNKMWQEMSWSLQISCGTVALMVLGEFFWYMRTIGLRISPYQKLLKVRGENPVHLFLQIIVMKKGSENDQTYMYRFIRYLSAFFYTYLSINNHFQLIIITNVSFVTSPAYFVSHLATPGSLVPEVTWFFQL